MCVHDLVLSLFTTDSFSIHINADVISFPCQSPASMFPSIVKNKNQDISTPICWGPSIVLDLEELVFDPATSNAAAICPSMSWMTVIGEAKRKASSPKSRDGILWPLNLDCIFTRRTTIWGRRHWSSHHNAIFRLFSGCSATIHWTDKVLLQIIKKLHAELLFLQMGKLPKAISVKVWLLALTSQLSPDSSFVPYWFTL